MRNAHEADLFVSYLRTFFEFYFSMLLSSILRYLWSTIILTNSYKHIFIIWYLRSIYAWFVYQYNNDVLLTWQCQLNWDKFFRHVHTISAVYMCKCVCVSALVFVYAKINVYVHYREFFSPTLGETIFFCFKIPIEMRYHIQGNQT